MDLSVIIVNYNVKFFLEQCLHAVMSAMEGMDAEVLVVDNNSVDGSCNLVREKFPWVKLIENHDNLGFSKANNQAIKKAAGEYILLLNPDTIVEENTFRICMNFMKSNPNAGGLGVKMIDGKGHFLPESKRALPTPWVAFYKIFGLSSLFPKSKKFGKYHLGYLDKDNIHQVDVLAGAFMFLRRKALEKVGLLDEQFFMYGEDIDLSYRITKGGFKNFYTPETTIIHYKGESTKKGSVNYVIAFYKAMIIFAKKHFSGRNASFYKLMINLAIYLRAFVAIVRRFAKRFYRQLIDGAIIFLGFYAGLPIWENLRFNNLNYYPNEFLIFIVPAYIFIWIMSVYYSGGYDRPVSLWKIVRGIFFGTFIILVVYALLPETLRFSRAAILLGTGWAVVCILTLRWVMHVADISDYKLDLNRGKRIVVVGEKAEGTRVVDILSQTQLKPEIIGFVSTEKDFSKPFIGTVDQIDEISRIHRPDEILFCSANISSQQIIKIMTRLSGQQVNYKIAPPESLSIIGSNSIHTLGGLYTIQFNSIGRNSNLRSKRLFDILASVVILVTFPFWLAFVKRPFRGFYRTVKVLLGFNTFIGYIDTDRKVSGGLHPLRKGILSPALNIGNMELNDEIVERINVFYAKDYKVATDLQLLIKGFTQIGTNEV